MRSRGESKSGMDKKQRMKKFRIMAIGIAALAVLTIVLKNGEEQRPAVTWPVESRPVKLATAQLKNGACSRAFPGIAMPASEVQLAFRVEGPLRDLPVDAGQFVKKGALVAQIDPRDFDVRVATLKAEHASLEARLVDARLRYERYRNLYATDAAARASLDAARAAHDQLEAQVDAVAAQLRDARNRREDTRLTAPFDGYVDRKFVENFDNVQAKQPIVSFLDCATIEVTAGVPEELIADGVSLQQFFCEFDAYPGRRFAAQFKELGRTPRPDNQSYPLTVTLSRPEGVMPRPGMAATLIVGIRQAQAAGYVLPAACVVNDGQGRSFVWVYDRDRGNVDRRFVKAGRMLRDGIEVLDGIHDGEQVVTAGANFLRPGQSVKPARENWRPLQDRSAEAELR